MAFGNERDSEFGGRSVSSGGPDLASRGTPGTRAADISRSGLGFGGSMVGGQLSRGIPRDRVTNIQNVGKSTRGIFGRGTSGVFGAISQLAPMALGMAFGIPGMVLGGLVSSGVQLSQGNTLGAGLSMASMADPTGVVGMAGMVNAGLGLAGYDVGAELGINGTGASGTASGRVGGLGIDRGNGPFSEVSRAAQISTVPTTTGLGGALTPGYTGPSTRPSTSLPGTTADTATGSGDSGAKPFGGGGPRRFGSYLA